VNFTYDKPKQSSSGQQYMMVRCRITVPLNEKTIKKGISLKNICENSKF